MALGDQIGMGFDNQLGSQFYGYDPMDVSSTFAGSPQAYYQTARLAALGNRAALPQFQRSVNLGFTPAYGSYLLGGAGTGGVDTFANYLGQGGAAGGAALPGQATLGQWQDALTASRTMGLNAQMPEAGLTASQLAIQGALQGEDARRNAIAMASAGMGGGVGYGAQARNRAVGNLFDLYSARAQAAGSTPGTFLNWLGGQVQSPLTNPPPVE